LADKNFVAVVTSGTLTTSHFNTSSLTFGASTTLEATINYDTNVYKIYSQKVTGSAGAFYELEETFYFIVATGTTEFVQLIDGGDYHVVTKTVASTDSYVEINVANYFEIFDASTWTTTALTGTTVEIFGIVGTPSTGYTINGYPVEIEGTTIKLGSTELGARSLTDMSFTIRLKNGLIYREIPLVINVKY